MGHKNIRRVRAARKGYIGSPLHKLNTKRQMRAKKKIEYARRHGRRK